MKTFQKDQTIKLLNYSTRSVIILTLVLINLCIYSCTPVDHPEKKESNSTAISIHNPQFKFGTIKPDDSVKKDFYIKNVGDNPLIIKNAKGSCGCTIAKWSSNPILSGDSTNITVVFKPTEETSGVIKKSIVIEANTEERFHVLYLLGTVVK